MGLSVGIGACVSILQLIALVFLILATISTPVVKSFSLAAANDYTYGVFGYCNQGTCSSATFPWVPSSLDDGVKNWAMSSLARDSLAKILIMSPIAAGIVLISLLLSVGAQFGLHTVSIISIAATILGFITSALICIVTIMLFYPNVSWTGWILVGSAAAMLVSLPLLLLGVKFGDYDSIDLSSLDDEDLTRFEDHHTESKFNYLPPNETNSSISRDYEYKPSNFNGGATNNFNNTGNVNNRGVNNPNTTMMSNNSMYNSAPQRAYDLTKQPSSGAGTAVGSNNFYNDDGIEKVSLVNGPNSTVSANRNMAPHLVPTVPQINNNNNNNSSININNNNVTTDLPPNNQASGKAPYPMSSNNSRNPNYNPTVFDHHPEVEGHKPFTELDDQEIPQHDILDSDDESDFTSVSQRAPNPQYYSQGPPPPPVHQQPMYPIQNGPPPPQQQYNNTYHHQAPPPQHQQHVPLQKQYQPQYSPVSPNPPQGYQQQPQLQPSYFNSQPGLAPAQPQPRGPTISDNALNNNPDFAVGGGFAKKKVLPMAPTFAQSPYNVTRVQRPGQNGRQNIPGASQSRDGPYGYR